MIIDSIQNEIPTSYTLATEMLDRAKASLRLPKGL